jgi:hypothetical protein
MSKCVKKLAEDTEAELKFLLSSMSAHLYAISRTIASYYGHGQAFCYDMLVPEPFLAPLESPCTVLNVRVLETNRWARSM